LLKSLSRFGIASLYRTPAQHSKEKDPPSFCIFHNNHVFCLAATGRYGINTVTGSFCWLPLAIGPISSALAKPSGGWTRVGLRSTNRSPGESSILLLSPGPGGNKQPFSMSFPFLAYKENQATNLGWIRMRRSRPNSRKPLRPAREGNRAFAGDRTKQKTRRVSSRREH
jgi:hypothetical protein